MKKQNNLFGKKDYFFQFDNSFKVLLYFLFVLLNDLDHFSNSGSKGVNVNPSLFSMTCSSSPSFRLYFSMSSFGIVNPKLLPTLRSLIVFIIITSTIL